MISYMKISAKRLGCTLACCMVVGVLFLASSAMAEPKDSSQPTQAACTFDDGKQMYVRYHPDAEKNLPFDKVWAPGGQAMLLFTETPLVAGDSDIPIGAYSLYVIPEKRQWTLVINRDVRHGTGYRESEDVARVPMEIGELEQPQQQTRIYFGHSAAQQCNMRIYHGTVGTWVEFKEK